MTDIKPICSNCKWWKQSFRSPDGLSWWGKCLGKVQGWPQKWADDTCKDFEVKEK